MSIKHEEKRTLDRRRKMQWKERRRDTFWDLFCISFVPLTLCIQYICQSVGTIDFFSAFLCFLLHPFEFGRKNILRPFWTHFECRYFLDTGAKKKGHRRQLERGKRTISFFFGSSISSDRCIFVWLCLPEMKKKCGSNEQANVQRKENSNDFYDRRRAIPWKSWPSSHRAHSCTLFSLFFIYTFLCSRWCLSPLLPKTKTYKIGAKSTGFFFLFFFFTTHCIQATCYRQEKYKDTSNVHHLVHSIPFVVSIT